MRFAALLLASVSLLAACGGEAPAPAADAKTGGPGYGGAKGADMSIAAIEPRDEPVTVGRAGDDPADIARYILAGGAAGVISPDGKLIALNWRITGAPQLWVVPVEGGQPRQLTFGNGITFFRWAPDSKAILYGADNNGNEQESFNLITADGVVEQELLAAKEGAFRLFGDFLPDGQSLLFSSPERNGTDFDIYMASPEGPPKLLVEGHLGTDVQSISPDGSTAIVTEGVGEDSDKLMLLDIRARKLTTIAAPADRANHADGGFAWTPDGKGFYFASNEGREFAALAFHDIAASTTTILHEAPYDIQQRRAVRAEAENGSRGPPTKTDSTSIAIQDRTTKKMLPAPALAEGVLGLNCSLGSSKMSINVNGWNTPGDILVLDLATGKTNAAFTGSLAGLDAKRLVKPVSMRMKARDGVELQGLLYLPDASSVQRRRQAARAVRCSRRPQRPVVIGLRQQGAILCRSRHRRVPAQRARLARLRPHLLHPRRPEEAPRQRARPCRHARLPEAGRPRRCGPCRRLGRLLWRLHGQRRGRRLSRCVQGRHLAVRRRQLGHRAGGCLARPQGLRQDRVRRHRRSGMEEILFREFAGQYRRQASRFRCSIPTA